MDNLDLMIASELDADCRQSFQSIAKKLGMTRRTVQRRVTKLVEIGFIRSFEVLFDHSALGLGQAVCNLRVRSNFGIGPIKEELLKVAGVTEVLTFVGGVLVTYISYGNQAQLEEILRRMGEIEGVADLDYEIGPKTDLPTRLGRSDWELLRCLNHKARRELAGIAKETGMSARTVQRRLRFLTKSGAIRFGLQVDVSKATDLFPYLLLVRMQPGATKTRIYAGVKQLVPSIWRNLRSVNPFLLTLASSAERLSDLERDVESVRTTLGVQAVSVLFNTSDSINNMWLDSMIQSASLRAVAR